MSEGRVFAEDIKNILESLSGWTGRVYVYIPPIRSEEDFNSYFLEAETMPDGKKRLNAWFINRTRLSPRKFGEAPRGVPLGYRARSHTYSIRGFMSVIKATPSGVSSEEEFQDICDNVEAALSIPVSLGHSDRTVVVGSIDLDIAYDNFGVVLCHVVTGTVTVTEYVITAHTL